MTKVCCICNNSKDGATSSFSGLSLGLDDVSSPTNGSVNVIFLLRNLLHIPSSILTSYLSSRNGGQGQVNPCDWGLWLCVSCSRHVTQAATLFSQIKDLINEYEAIGGALRSLLLQQGNINPKTNTGSKRRSRSKSKFSQGNDSTSNMWQSISRHFSDTNDSNIKEENSHFGESNTFESPINVKSEPVSDEDPFDLDLEDLLDQDIGELCDPLEQNPISSSISIEPAANDRKSRKCRKVVKYSSSYSGDELDEVEVKRSPQMSEAEASSGSDEEEMDSEGSDSNFEIDPEDINQKKAVPNKRKISSRKKKWKNTWDTKCPSCPASVQNEVILEAHIARKHKGVTHPYSCELCSKSYTRMSEVLLHIDDKHENEIKNNLVSEDSEKANFHSIFETTENAATYTKTFTCRLCQVTFESRIMSELHFLRLHSVASTNFPCSTCPSMFLTKEGLRRHGKKTHVSFICQLCNHDCKSMCGLGKHNIDHHPNLVTKPHLCELCPQAYTTLGSLQQHRRKEHHVELGLTPFKCGVCDKIFDSKRTLDFHIVAQHTKDFTFLCHTCGKGYAREDRLKIHIRNIHTPALERDYKCEHCGKQFWHISHWRQHLRTHTGEKPFTCEVEGCGKRFARRDVLKVHALTHTQERNETCALCGKSFKDLTALNRHTMGVHERKKDKT